MDDAPTTSKRPDKTPSAEKDSGKGNLDRPVTLREVIEAAEHAARNATGDESYKAFVNFRARLTGQE